jgi:hypothetical protein
MMGPCHQGTGRADLTDTIMLAAAMPELQNSYTIAEAAALSGMHKNTIRLRIKLGQLEADVRQGKFGEEYRIPHAALIRAGLVEGALEGGAQHENCLDEAPTAAEQERAGPPGAGGEELPVPAFAGSLADLFQRHEQAMFRLGYMQSEMERLKSLAGNAESLRQDRMPPETEIAELRQQLDEARDQLRDAETTRKELEQARQRLQDADDLRRLLADMERETARLRTVVEASQHRRPWWKRLGSARADATPGPAPSG